MSGNTAEEHWNDKCTRYLESIVPVRRRATVPSPQHRTTITPPVYGNAPFRNRPTRRDVVRDANNDESVLQNGARSRFLLSSAHGVPFMAHARSKCECAAWFAAIACAVLVAISVAAFVTWKYFNDVPTLRTRYLSECCRQLPAVTICNNNLFRQSRLAGSRFANLSNIDIRNVHSQTVTDDYAAASTVGSETFSDFLPENGVELNEDFLREIDGLNSIHAKHENDWQQMYEHPPANDHSNLRMMLHPSEMELESLGHSQSSLVMRCLIDGKLCDTRLIRKTSHPLHGNCFTVDEGQLREKSTHITHFGLGTGLRLTLDAEVTEYIGVLTDVEGFKVFIHPLHEQFYHYAYILTTPGRAAYIGAKEVVSRVHSEPCNKDDTYSIQMCLESCLNDMTELLCRCSVLSVADRDARCNPFNKTQYICREVLMKLHSDQVIKCDCRKPCTYTDYSVIEHVTTPWPSFSHMSQLVAQLSVDYPHADQHYIRKNVAMVNIFMSSSEYEERTEVNCYEWHSLLADVGGISALFVGVSLLTILEFCFVVCHTLCCGCCGRRGEYHAKKNRVRYAEGFGGIPKDQHKSAAYIVNPQATHHDSNPEREYTQQVPARMAGINDVYLPECPKRTEADVHNQRWAQARVPAVQRKVSIYRRAFQEMQQSSPFERVLVPGRYISDAPVLHDPQRARAHYENRGPGNVESGGDVHPGRPTLGNELSRFRRLHTNVPVSRKITM